MALAINLRDSARNVREKEKKAKPSMDEDKKQGRTISFTNSYIMAFQARAMHHALYNAFFIAKKAAGRIG